MTQLHLCDLIFTCQQPINRPPQFPAVRLAAWLRFACRAAALDPQAAYTAICPLRYGAAPLSVGDKLRVRLILSKEQIATLPKLLEAFASTDHGGTFNPRTLALTAAVDPLAQSAALTQPALPDQPDQSMPTSQLPSALKIPDSLVRLDGETLAPEQAFAATLQRFTLYFALPLRLTLPAGYKHKSFKSLERFCTPTFFENEPRAAGHLLNSLRGFERSESADTPNPDSGASTCGLTVTSAALTWSEQRYSRERHINLGGVTGVLVLQGKPTPAALLRLVTGQYLGSGKAARSGLGFYRILELDPVRVAPLP